MSSPWKDFPNSDTPPPRRIVCDAHTCFGKPRIEGTRLHLLLFVGMTREQVVEAWPDLNLTDEEWTAIQNWLASAAGRRAQQQETQAAPGFPNNKTERPFEGIPAGQEPEVMPGFTAPATDPWPPLSREQVVELHEALIEFLKAPMKAPNRLAMRLLALNIGTPPQPRRWTDDDIQAVLEKREAADPTGFQAPPVHYVQQERETIDRIRDSMTDDQFVAFCWGNVMKYRDRADSKGDPEADTRKALWYERMMLHVAVGSADPRSDRPNFQPYHRQPSDMPLVWVVTAPSPTASLVSSPLGATLCPLCRGSGQARSVQQINPDGSYEPKDAPLVNCMVCEGTGQISPEDEVQEEVKRNCGTCGNDDPDGPMGQSACSVHSLATSRWAQRVGMDRRGMPDQDSDGCPGWEPKP